MESATGPGSQYPQETIVAISTPPGRGGIGIVRLSGPKSVAITGNLVRLRHPLVPAMTRFAVVLDPEQTTPDARLDEAIVTWFAAPHSYTGEDLVEIAAHGSPVILDLLVRQALQHGARLAEPGEFTQRAFLSGRIDLTQAEAVRDLIDAQTLHQARTAAAQMGGALSSRIHPIKQMLVNLIATLEAGIDFADDDVEVISSDNILESIRGMQALLETIAASFAQGRIVHSGFSLAVIGRPNVGKSSLFNCIAERDRSIVTANPGTTRDLVTERVSIGGIPLEVIDTAGLREASDEAESIGIHKSREASAEADIILLVLDATDADQAVDRELLAAIANRPAVVALNKSDLANDPDIPAELSSLKVVRTSAATGSGIEDLRRRILIAAGASGEPQSGLLTNLRQHQAVSASLLALAAAIHAAENRTPHEMLLLDLYDALHHLDALTGNTTPDDILNLIFSTFCIGK